MSHRIGWNAVNYLAKKNIPEHDSIGSFVSDPVPPTPDTELEELEPIEPIQKPHRPHKKPKHPMFVLHVNHEMKELATYAIFGFFFLILLDWMYKAGVEKGRRLAMTPTLPASGGRWF